VTYSVVNSVMPKISIRPHHLVITIDLVCVPLPFVTAHLCGCPHAECISSKPHPNRATRYYQFLAQSINMATGVVLTKALRSLKRSGHKPTLRKSITPGKVLILLTGKHRGSRVVFLKQLPSGLLLVTGPYKLNGVPVRRVAARQVIATSSKVELPKAVVDATANLTDEFFQKAKVTDAQAAKKFISKPEAKKPAVNPDRVKLQKTIDEALLPNINQLGKDFVQYLRTPFSLRKGQFPHAMKF